MYSIKFQIMFDKKEVPVFSQKPDCITDWHFKNWCSVVCVQVCADAMSAD